MVFSIIFISLELTLNREWCDNLIQISPKWTAYTSRKYLHVELEAALYFCHIFFPEQRFVQFDISLSLKMLPIISLCFHILFALHILISAWSWTKTFSDIKIDNCDYIAEIFLYGKWILKKINIVLCVVLGLTYSLPHSNNAFNMLMTEWVIIEMLLQFDQ